MAMKTLTLPLPADVWRTSGCGCHLLVLAPHREGESDQARYQRRDKTPCPGCGRKGVLGTDGTITETTEVK